MLMALPRRRSAGSRSSARPPAAPRFPAPRRWPRPDAACTPRPPARIAGLSVAGSTSNTSSAAPATWPDRSAAASAASSTSPPRAQLMMRTPGFIRAKASAERIFLVASVSGVCSVMKSARARDRRPAPLSPRPDPAPASPSDTDHRRSPSSSGPWRGPRRWSRYCRSRSGRAFCANSSTPRNRFFSHLPALVEALASGIWRARANIMAMACSAVVMVLPRACSSPPRRARWRISRPHCPRRCRRGRPL